ncbi:MAG: GNAT family N-acetyltransferase [Oscillospiraceae bacterium]|nr:GNAT family N-acetyltransferase [Oscillospiraceae bacterium]
MPIKNIEQLNLIPVDETLRLRAFDGIPDCALGWYQDVDTVWLVDGNRVPYTETRLNAMYSWLHDHGELYFIQVLENGTWKPIGDVTFWREDMPIVIGDPEYRGKGIGGRVVAALIQRGRQLGYEKLYVNEIYDHNPGSRHCFEKAGFRACEKTEKGNRFVLEL